MKSAKQINEEIPFQLEKGSILVNGKYKVIAKIGTGHKASVYAVSCQKGQKQLVRAIKVVTIVPIRKVVLSKSHRSELKYQY